MWPWLHPLLKKFPGVISGLSLGAYVPNLKTVRIFSNSGATRCLIWRTTYIQPISTIHKQCLFLFNGTCGAWIPIGRRWIFYYPILIQMWYVCKKLSWKLIETLLLKISQSTTVLVMLHSGTVLLVKSSIPHQEITLHTSLQAVAVRATSFKTVTICSVYLPPSLKWRKADIWLVSSLLQFYFSEILTH